MTNARANKAENAQSQDNQELHALESAVQSLADAARHLFDAKMPQASALVRDMVHKLHRAVEQRRREAQVQAAGVLLRQADARHNAVVFMPDDAGGDAPLATETGPAAGAEISRGGVGVPAARTNPPPTIYSRDVSKKNRTACGGTETKENKWN